MIIAKEIKYNSGAIMPDPIPGATPESEIEKSKTQPTYAIEEVSEDDPEYTMAIPISLTGDETDEQIRADLERSMPYFFWWTQPEWKEKGNPLEIIKLDFASGRTIEVYNWLRPLSQKEQERIKDVMQTFATIGHGKTLESTRYILISDKVYNPEATLATGEDVNGSGTLLPFQGHPLNGIQIYPHAFEGEHRTGVITNFEGTLNHEMTHHLIPIGDPFQREWEERFGKERHFISEYAKSAPKEDICDSMVALLSENDALDPEKGKILRERFLTDQTPDSITNATVLQGNDAQLPSLETVYYRKSGVVILEDSDS